MIKGMPKKAIEFFAAKMAFTTGPIELKGMLERKEALVIVDVRHAEDFEKGHIPGAINLPKEKWHTAAGLSKDAVNILYCYSQTCHLAPEAALEFAAEGYPVMEMEGGFDAWKANGLSIEGKESRRAA